MDLHGKGTSQKTRALFERKPGLFFMMFQAKKHKKSETALGLD
jgi:hypothetical protein